MDDLHTANLDDGGSDVGKSEFEILVERVEKMESKFDEVKASAKVIFEAVQKGVDEGFLDFHGRLEKIESVISGVKTADLQKAEAEAKKVVVVEGDKAAGALTFRNYEGQTAVVSVVDARDLLNGDTAVRNGDISIHREGENCIVTEHGQGIQFMVPMEQFIYYVNKIAPVAG